MQQRVDTPLIVRGQVDVCIKGLIPVPPVVTARSC